MKEHNIFAPVLWPFPEAIKQLDINEDIGYIYKHALALPCDQRYSLSDMEKIVECFRNYAQENGETNDFF